MGQGANNNCSKIVRVITLKLTSSKVVVFYDNLSSRSVDIYRSCSTYYACKYVYWTCSAPKRLVGIEMDKKH